MSNPFLITEAPFLEDHREQKYDHGFLEEEVERVKKQKLDLNKRDLRKFPPSREEFRNTIVPFLVINRTEVFNLNAGKEKKPKAEKVPKIPKEKVVKVKKLSKKAIKEKLQDILFKKATGGIISEEDELFLQEQKNTLI